MKFVIKSVVVVLLFLHSSCSNEERYEKTYPKYINLNEYIFAQGEIYPNNYEEIVLSSGGMVSNILKKEGQIVRKNDIIAKILTYPTTTTSPNFSELIKKINKKPSDFNRLASTSKLPVNFSPVKMKEITIRSKSNGIVYVVDKIKGEYFSAGEPIMIIGSPNAMCLKLNVEEEEIMKININDYVKININAVPDSVYSGIVSSISHKKSYENKFFVYVTIENFRTTFYGLSAEAQISSRKRERVLVIPTSFLQHGDSITVIINDKQVKKRIKVGVRNTKFTEVADTSVTTRSQIVKPMSGNFNF